MDLEDWFFLKKFDFPPSVLEYYLKASFFLIFVQLSSQSLPCVNLNQNECENVSKIIERSNCVNMTDVAKKLTQMCLHLDPDTMYFICINESCDIHLTNKATGKLFEFLRWRGQINILPTTTPPPPPPPAV